MTRISPDITQSSSESQTLTAKDPATIRRASSHPKKLQFNKNPAYVITNKKPAVKKRPSQHVSIFAKEAKGVKLQSVCFFVIVGGIMVVIGIGLTYVAASRDLSDFYILGIGAILIGSVFLMTAAIIVAREKYIKRKKEREIEELVEKNRKIVKDYNIPKDTCGKAEPSGSALYGYDNYGFNRKISEESLVFDGTKQAQPDANSLYKYHRKDIENEPPPPVSLPHTPEMTLEDREKTTYFEQQLNQKSLKVSFRQDSASDADKSDGEEDGEQTTDRKCKDRTADAGTGTHEMSSDL